MSSNKKLDELYGEFLNYKLQPTTLPDVGEGGMTIVECSVDAFELKPSIAGRSLSIIPHKDDGVKRIGVIRQLLGLAFSSRIEHSLMLGYHELALLKNSMLAQAAKHFNFGVGGFDGSYEWTFQYPDGTFFRDMDTHAGYKIRLYISHKNQIEPLDTTNTEVNRKIIK